MALTDKARTVPRVHLFGTLFIVAALTIALASFFSWQQIAEHRTTLERLEQVLVGQLEERLTSEMQSAKQHLQFVRSRTESVLKQHISDKVDLALQIAESIHARAAARSPPDEIGRQIVETLRPIRFFDDRGYFFIDDMAGRFILLPTAPQFEGQLAPDNRDDTGHPIMQGLIDAARKPPGEGYSKYRWYRPDDPLRMADKLAYVRHFAPYDWLIGTGDYTYEWERVQQRDALAGLRSMRFGRSGYVAVLDHDGRTLLFPADPSIEGRLFSELAPPQLDAVREIYEKARSGGGFIHYQWPRADSDGGLANKLARVEVTEPWGWILIVTVFEDDVKGALDHELSRYEAASHRSLVNLGLTVAAAVLAALAAAVLFSRWSGRLFNAYHLENQAQREALRQQAAELRESESKLNVILDSVEAYIYIKGTDYRYQYANRRTCELFGCHPEDVLGRGDAAFFDARSVQALHANDRLVIEAGERVAAEELNTDVYGAATRAYLSIKIPLRRESGEIYALCGISTDITQRKAMEDEIRQLAFYDPLTHLPNRRLLIDRLQQLLATNARASQHGALLFIDLDNFKTLNDTLGHDKGDILLQQVAARLVTCVREGDTVARLGGDEFVIMLRSLGSVAADAAAHTKQVGEKVLERLGQPFLIDSLTHFSTASVGATVFTGREHSVEDLLKQADLAMYQAKSAGRNTLRFFDPEMQAALSARATLEADMRLGVEQNQFVLFYQPQVDQHGTLIGTEALVRWQHPERGLLSPGTFIPLAEDSGLILPLGAWVLETACTQLSIWNRQPDTRHLTLAVNVSARQFRQHDFAEGVLATLARTGAAPGRLKLELTESLLLADVDDSIAKMSILKAQGVSFSLDDFGTGYSSLAYLKSLPIDQLKIDRSFVRDLLTDPNDAAIARAIVTLAGSLGLTVIAEGVETAEQRDCLAQQGCNTYQGYYFGCPMPADQLCLVPKILSPASPRPGMM